MDAARQGCTQAGMLQARVLRHSLTLACLAPASLSGQSAKTKACLQHELHGHVQRRCSNAHLPAPRPSASVLRFSSAHVACNREVASARDR